MAQWLNRLRNKIFIIHSLTRAGNEGNQGVTYTLMLANQVLYTSASKSALASAYCIIPNLRVRMQD